MGIFARIKKAWYDSIIWETIDKDFYDELEESCAALEQTARDAQGRVESAERELEALRRSPTPTPTPTPEPTPTTTTTPTPTTTLEPTEQPGMSDAAQSAKGNE